MSVGAHRDRIRWIAVTLGLATTAAACSVDDGGVEHSGASRTFLRAAETSAAAAGDPDRTGERTLAPLPVSSRDITAAERASLGELKAKLPKEPAVAVLDSTVSALADAARLDPEQKITVTLELTDTGEALAGLRTAPEGDRAKVIEARKLEVRATQDSVAAAVSAIGGTVGMRFWLVNQLQVTLPAGRLASIAKAPFVIAAHSEFKARATAAALSGYSGLEARTALLTDRFISDGRTAIRGSRYDGGRVRIGLFEPMTTSSGANVVNDHIGFKTSASGPTRLYRRYVCNPTCTIESAPSPQVATHATAVAGVLAGSIENGQDPVFPSAPATIQHSGQAQQAIVYYYRFDTASGMKSALEWAVADGVDIVNFSAGFPYAPDPACNPGLNADGLNEAIRNTYDQGVLIFQAAGNNGYSGSVCNMWYPAWRPEVLAVNGLNTESSDVNYASSTLSAVAAARGWAPMQLNIGASVARAGIYAAAPGVATLAYRDAPINYTTGSSTGSSFASPMAAGAAALLRNALYDHGWGTDGRYLFAHMLLQADGFDQISGTQKSTAFSNLTGAGRMRMHFPASASLVGPWLWEQRTFWLNPGQVVTFPLASGGAVPAGVRQWKWASYWNEANLNAVSDVDVQVWDTCTNTQLASQFDFDLRNRVDLRDSQIAGRCIEMRVIAYSLTAPLFIWSADFYHGAIG